MMGNCQYFIIGWISCGGTPNLKLPGTSTQHFKYLIRVAEVVVILPHSNTEEERLFSIVRKNKTESRSSMKPDGTLSSILSMKHAYPESDVCLAIPGCLMKRF